MPYYCTVPRCTSMAGKAKNVSFHQFPRDQELAKLWNNILKRGKPYTKYSKVCSLHFKPEDYTITSAGKNKGQWRTLRKDAIPSQNLPSDTPAPYQRRQSSGWFSSNNMPSNIPAIDPQIQQQLAQAIYMQTMLAMQAAGVTDPLNFSAICNGLAPALPTDDPEPHTSSPPVDSASDHESEPHRSDSHEGDSQENDAHKDNRNVTLRGDEHDSDIDHESDRGVHESDVNHRRNYEPPINGVATSYKCDDCSKCFKDPDVYILHKRSHKSDRNGVQVGKENFDLNTIKPEMLRSNPILANLLKSTVEKNIFNTNLFEKQLMVSFSSMENYLRGVSQNDYDDCDSTISDNLDDNNLVIDENVA